MAKEFKLSPIITGGREADLAAADLKASGARIFSLNYPTRSRSLGPDADEPIRELRLRAHAPKAPAGLSKAGVPFAFSSSGLTSTSDFVKNAARAVKEGLPADAAIRALTLDAATIAGVADRLGSLEKGKIANVIMTDGDLFGEHTTIKLVLIDGQRVNFDAAETPQRTRARRPVAALSSLASGSLRRRVVDPELVRLVRQVEFGVKPVSKYSQSPTRRC